jgi:hypothetical protein
MNLTENLKTKEGYNQVCVWPGCALMNTTVEEFEKSMLQDIGIKVQFLEEIETGSDMKNGVPVPETGGRHDLFFAIHDEDVGKFVLKRFQYDIRWLEDVLASCNYHSPIYPKRVFEYCIWNKEHLAKQE